MTIRVKEFDGARSVEFELKEGVVYVDGGRHSACFAFDSSILVRAMQRELGVNLTGTPVEQALKPCGEDPRGCRHSGAPGQTFLV